MSGLEPLLIASTIATVAGTAISAAGSIAAGEAQAQQAQNEAEVRRWQAKQYEMKGKEERALASRQADQLRREKNLALSRLQAVSAGSGFMPTGATELQTAGEIEKYGTLRQQMALYGGASKANEANLAAAGSRYSAMMSDNMASAYSTVGGLNAAGTIASGAGSIFAKYAPSKAPSTLGYTTPFGGISVPTYG